LNTDSDEADVTSLGRLFHTFAPATGKARPPTVDRRQVGTSSCSEEVDMSVQLLNGTLSNDSAIQISLAKPPTENKQKDVRKRMQNMQFMHGCGVYMYIPRYGIFN